MHITKAFADNCTAMRRGRRIEGGTFVFKLGLAHCCTTNNVCRGDFPQSRCILSAANKFQVIALYLRQPSMGRWSYVYLQVFAGVCYLAGSGFMFELWRVHRKKKRLTAAAAMESADTL